MTLRANTPAAQAAAEQYAHLERRSESWRRQLYVKGRNMTVDHLVRGILANKLTPAEAAENYDLPLDAIHEALDYYERHRDLIEQDWEDEREYLRSRGLHP